MQDCTIDATQGLAGVQGSCASGGHHAGVTVIGGRIGLDFRNDDRPGPLMTGVTLTGQTESAIVFSGRQTLTAVGLKITVPGRGPAIVGEVRGGVQGGQINLVDSEIVFAQPAETNTAIYMCNSEHAISDVKMEIRGSRYITLYSLKSATTETKKPPLWIRDSDHVRLFGIGGIAMPEAGRALMSVSNTPTRRPRRRTWTDWPAKAAQQSPRIEQPLHRL